jgi:hypothetical protein
VALPAYDVRVTWRPDGRLASVEGERPLLAGPTDGELLSAPPQMLRQFLDALHRVAPDNLVGVVWFRLPTDADARAWSLDTWRAVIAGDLPAAQLKGQLKAGLSATERPGVWTVTLSNEGSIDAALPRQVRLGAACEMADGANGYRLASAEGPMILETTAGGRLRPHRQRVIGWARCGDPGNGAGKGLDVVQ